MNVVLPEPAMPTQTMAIGLSLGVDAMVFDLRMGVERVDGYEGEPTKVGQMRNLKDCADGLRLKQSRRAKGGTSFRVVIGLMDRLI